MKRAKTAGVDADHAGKTSFSSVVYPTFGLSVWIRENPWRFWAKPGKLDISNLPDGACRNSTFGTAYCPSSPLHSAKTRARIGIRGYFTINYGQISGRAFIVTPHHKKRFSPGRIR